MMKSNKVILSLILTLSVSSVYAGGDLASLYKQKEAMSQAQMQQVENFIATQQYYFSSPSQYPIGVMNLINSVTVGAPQVKFSGNCDQVTVAANAAAATAMQLVGKTKVPPKLK